MDYKEKVIALLNSKELTKEQKEKLKEIFPELRESEDEKIRKELIDYHRSMAAQADDYVHEAWIAWLEKQGEYANFCNKIQVGDKVTRNRDGVLVNLSQLNRIAKPANKIDPKFKVGDWVIFDNGNVELIISIGTHGYTFDDGDYLLLNECDKIAHLWTIQDAKDGDVLAFYGEYKGNKMLQVGIIERYVGKHCGCSNTFKIYVGVNWENNLQIGEYMGCSDIRPATKEQRDTLMKAMADAGYTFDFEKKKLKKIEQKQVIDYPNNLPKDNWELIHEFVEKLGRIPKEKDELDLLVEYVLKRKKSTWSEKDEQHIDSLLKRLDGLCRNEFERTRFAINEDKDWLESLKERIGG